MRQKIKSAFWVLWKEAIFESGKLHIYMMIEHWSKVTLKFYIPKLNGKVTLIFPSFLTHFFECLVEVQNIAIKSIDLVFS